MQPDIARLIRAESYAHGRWLLSGGRSALWLRLATAMGARLRAHPEYKGAA